MDKPIIFSTDMVKAILAGRKTQTRRVIKPQPEGQPMYCYAGGSNRDIRKWHHGGKKYKPPCNGDDILWVRETWADNIPGCPNGITYRADHIDPYGNGPAHPINWKPSIHMSRAISRISLLVKCVGVERLQDITEDDAKAEGVQEDYPMDSIYCPTCGGSGAIGTYNRTTLGYMDVDCSSCDTAIKRYKNLWDSINAKRGFSFNSNPWVWKISFEVMK